MIMFTSFLLSIAIINLVSCGGGTIESKEISKTAVFRNYIVNYDQTEKQLSAYARFSAGGPLETSIALTEPSMVLINNQKMEKSDGRQRKINFVGTFYNYTLEKSSVPSSAEITWHTDDGVFVRDQIKFPSAFVIQSPSENNVIRTSEDVSIEVESSKLQDDEEWNVTLISKATSGEEKVKGKCCFNESFQSDKIVIGKDLIGDLREGDAELTLARVKTDRKNKDSVSAGASIRSKISQKMAVKISK